MVTCREGLIRRPRLVATPSPGQRLNGEADPRRSAWACLYWVHHQGVIALEIINLWQAKGEGA